MDCKEVLNNLSKTLIKRIKDGRMIGQESLWKLLEVATEIISNGDTENLGDDYYTLEVKVRSYYQYGYLENMESERVFELGEMYAVIEMINKADKKNKEPALIRSFAEKYLEYYQFFLTIKEFPGIEFFELAEKTKINVTELKEMILSLEREYFFSYSRRGKQTYFYIHKRGEALIKAMEEIKG